MGNTTENIKQQRYRENLKSKGLKMVMIPLLERDIKTAVEITLAQTERDAIYAIFQRGLEKQRDLLDQPVINNQLITAINHEREKLQQEIAAYEREGKQWRKNQRILAKLELLENLQPAAPSIATTHAG
jgi:hypothetical protein